jgi:hypothetical protein
MRMRFWLRRKPPLVARAGDCLIFEAPLDTHVDVDMMKAVESTLGCPCVVVQGMTPVGVVRMPQLAAHSNPNA